MGTTVYALCGGVWPNQIPNTDWILDSDWLTRRRLCKQMSHGLGDVMWLVGNSWGYPILST